MIKSMASHLSVHITTTIIIIVAITFIFPHTCLIDLNICLLSRNKRIQRMPFTDPYLDSI